MTGAGKPARESRCAQPLTRLSRIPLLRLRFHDSHRWRGAVMQTLCPIPPLRIALQPLSRLASPLARCPRIALLVNVIPQSYVFSEMRCIPMLFPYLFRGAPRRVSAPDMTVPRRRANLRGTERAPARRWGGLAAVVVAPRVGDVAPILAALLAHGALVVALCFAIVDVVSRKWIDTLVSVEETATQVQVIFERSLQIEGLLDLLTDERLDLDPDDPRRPILLAVSDNGPPMTAEATRAFMALMAIAQHHGRPHTPTDQAWIESFFGHLKSEWPHLETITDPATLDVELERVRMEYNTVRLHEAIGYVTPDDEHTGRGEAIRQARRDGLDRARQRRLDYHRRTSTNPTGETP